MCATLLSRLKLDKTDRDKYKNKGFGFCEYQDEETAISAVRNYMPISPDVMSFLLSFLLSHVS